jgi:anti-anti-sigma regulatory factor
MKYQINDGALAIEVTLRGRMEFGDHPTFRELTGKLNASPAKKIILNLSGVEFIAPRGSEC